MALRLLEKTLNKPVIEKSQHTQFPVQCLVWISPLADLRTLSSFESLSESPSADVIRVSEFLFVSLPNSPGGCARSSNDLSFDCVLSENSSKQKSSLETLLIVTCWVTNLRLPVKPKACPLSSLKLSEIRTSDPNSPKLLLLQSNQKRDFWKFKCLQ